jgi:hypothetical protein
MTRKTHTDKVCCLCSGKIDIQYHPTTGKKIWELGHNAQPIRDGQCCSFCNDTKVLPARLGLIHSDKIH